MTLARPRSASLVESSALGRCTADVETFLADAWGRRPAVEPGADAAGFADLLAFDDVDALLTTSAIRTPAFRLVRSDRRIDEREYTRTGTTGSRRVSGMVDPARVLELFRDGATIVLQGLHRYREPVARFTRALELELGHPCQVNAYLTPPGAQGLALHDDPHDVFVLQVFGRKRWEVHEAPGEPQREPMRFALSPGDAAYLPTGTPHAASTQEVLSGHLTVGVHVSSWREVLDDAWSLVRDDPSLSEPLPPRWTSDPGRLAAELGPRIAAARERLAELDPETLAARRRDRFLTTRPPLLRGALADALELDAIDDATRLARREGSVCVLRPGEERLSLLLGDRRLEVPAWLEPAIRRIRDDEGPFALVELADEISDAGSRVVLARRLVREGLLRLVR